MADDRWLIRQLEAWPTRVHPQRTTSAQYLMQEAAVTLQASQTALQDALVWHEGEEKALSKQPPSADGNWRRMQHQEQIALLAAAIRLLSQEEKA